MLKGLMQSAPLQISGLLQFAGVAHGDREIVSRLLDEPLWRYSWADCAGRAKRLAQALSRLGVDAGDRVSSLAWNTHRHIELMFAVPGMGAVLHTANPRLSDEHILHTINEASAKVLLFDRNLLPLVERLRERLPAIRHFIMLCDELRLEGGSCNAGSYEVLLSAETGTYDWPQFDENAGAILCYTSGTTGNPKGVLYSHRSITLHALASGLSGAMNLSAFDVVLPASSLYHANGWGVPFAAAINGCKFVLPADKLDGASLHELICSEGVTISAGVPTVWTTYLEYLRSIGGDAGSLSRVMIGGSALPEVMAVALGELGVTAIHALGMTEASPLIVVSTPTPKLLAEAGEDTDSHLRARQGRAMFGIELRLLDETGGKLPWDGASAGSLQLRGPWVAQHYYPDLPAADRDGWFDTGDMATIDRFGFLRITDRKKDVIKSGGEWISSIDLENVASGCQGVRLAAVIGVYHPRWEERPLMIVERDDQSNLTSQQLRAYLEPLMARWWLPDDILIAPIPLTATGKIDKRALRERYRDYLIVAQ